MAIELSLDAVDEMAQEDYADVIIPLPSGNAALLAHPLRMSDEKRASLADYFQDLQESDDAEGEDSAKSLADGDLVSQAQDLLRILVDGDPGELFEALADDATKYQAVVKFYFEAANPGEA